MTTEEFIMAHRTDDVRRLALQGNRYPDIDMPFALDQIAGWQTARTKLPSWVAVDGIVYPPHLSMEQCSSEQTARYKARLAERLTGGKGEMLIDLTGGFGVDFSFMARVFSRSIYVERQEKLCEAVRNNLPLLGLSHAEVVCDDGIGVLHTIEHASVIFLDPARRNANGGKTIAISDCTPDVTTVLDELTQKADHVIVKLSPLLDWHKAVADLRGKVSEVHIVSVGNECKELLLVLSDEGKDNVKVFCVNDSCVFEYESKSHSTFHTPHTSTIAPHPTHLFEPNASIMKAGCFTELAERYSMKPVSMNSHLFVSDTDVPEFPGRRFVIDAITTMNRKILATALKGIDRANITVRNFPLSVAELRKRIKLKDGGDTYIFATTLGSREHVLIICHKILYNI